MPPAYRIWMGSNPRQKEITGSPQRNFPLFGPSDWIRTSGLLNPIQARYQTSPHPDILLFLSGLAPSTWLYYHRFLKYASFFFKKSKKFFLSCRSAWKGLGNQGFSRVVTRRGRGLATRFWRLNSNLYPKMWWSRRELVTEKWSGMSPAPRE